MVTPSPTNEERYRALALAAAQIVWTQNAQGEMVGDWPLWRAFTGQSLEEMSGRGWANAVYADDREPAARAFAQAAENAAIYEVEYRLRRHDGEYRHMAARGVPVLDAEGRVCEWVGVCADITEQRQAQEQARQSQHELALKTRFATIFLTLPQRELFAAVLDAVVDHTQSEQGIFGYLDEEGSLAFPIWAWDDEAEQSPVPGETVRFARAEWTGLWARALNERRGLYSNEPLRRVLAAPILFQGEPIGLFAVANKPAGYNQNDCQTLERIARDIAPVMNARLQRDAAEQEVRSMNAELEKRVAERTAQLEAANRELEAFAYSVSHDLRAPLRAIHGFSRILFEENASELSTNAKHYLEVVRDNALQMGRLIDDLLAFSRLSRQALAKRRLAPADLVRQALQQLNPEMQPRIEIIVGDLPACQGDPALLKQVFINLLSNAIKYSSRREHARIEIGAQPAADGRTTVYYVRDNGAGFDMRYIHKLFGVFQRLHHAGDYPGTGIGLATVQRIVHRHGGRVWAESEVDRGATFYFTLEPES